MCSKTFFLFIYFHYIFLLLLDHSPWDLHGIMNISMPCIDAELL